MEGFCHTTHTTHTRAIEIEYPHIIIHLDIDIYYRNIDIAHIGWISYRSKGVESIITLVYTSSDLGVRANLCCNALLHMVVCN